LTATTAASGFELDAAWQLAPQISVRPEPFGALLYHFGTRRLSFLKNQTIVTIVRALAEHPSARAACEAAGVGTADLPPYQAALASLADTETIIRRADRTTP
jgi:putative mycofactocin binding protein MftB